MSCCAVTGHNTDLLDCIDFDLWMNKKDKEEKEDEKEENEEEEEEKEKEGGEGERWY